MEGNSSGSSLNLTSGSQSYFQTKSPFNVSGGGRQGRFVPQQVHGPETGSVDSGLPMLFPLPGSGRMTKFVSTHTFRILVLTIILITSCSKMNRLSIFKYRHPFLFRTGRFLNGYLHPCFVNPDDQ